MNVQLPTAPAAYTKAWGDSLTQALVGAFAKVIQSGVTIQLPAGATITLTDASGHRWAISIDNLGALTATPL